MGSCGHIFHCIYIEFPVLTFFSFLTYLVLTEWKKTCCWSPFFIKTLKFSKFVADDSIAQEIQDSNNFSGIFQPRI